MLLTQSNIAHYRSLINPSSLFFFTATATTEIYTLSLHDALPIYNLFGRGKEPFWQQAYTNLVKFIILLHKVAFRSEEHTSELQSLTNLVCRLLLEKKKKREYISANPV